MLASAYDLNGNLTAQTVNGQMTRFTWDDEDRLASTTLPEGHTDGNTYTGLGMRLSKTDGGVSYAYLCDGVSPASPVLSDGQLSFTPGISQTLGTPNGSGGMSYASHFYAEDAVGNLRGMSDGGAQGFPDAYNWDAFGQLIGRAGGTSTPFGYGEASGYQADGDTGLKLLGHRYYDSRTGRFISQDPAGDGENWYAYCDNDPVDGVDPDGLSMQMPPTGETMAHDAMMGFLGGLSFGGSGMGGDGSYTKTDYHYQWQQTGTWQPNGTGGLHVVWQDDWSTLGLTDVTSTTFDMGGSGMFAADTSLDGTAADAHLTRELAAADDGTAGTLKANNPFKGLEDAVKNAKDWLGKEVNAITNKEGDSVFMNKEGTKKLRFDIKHPHPHANPHAHIEELINGKWRGVRIYPRDVPPR